MDPSRANAPYRLLLLLARVTARHDELGRTLVLARLHSLGGLAPRRDRMPAAAGAPAERVIDRVHDLAADMAAPSHPACAAGLADRHVHIVGVRYGADRGDAAAMDHTLFAGIQPQDDVFAVASDNLGIGSGRARDLAALADFQFDIVHNGADRDVRRRHRIARFHIDVLPGNNGVAYRKPLRRQNVSEL